MAAIVSEPELVALGRRVQELRTAVGLTQAELGERMGAHRVSVVRIESGAVDVSFTTLLSLADALGVTLTDLSPAARPRGKWK